MASSRPTLRRRLLLLGVALPLLAAALFTYAVTRAPTGASDAALASYLGRRLGLDLDLEGATLALPRGGRLELSAARLAIAAPRGFGERPLIEATGIHLVLEDAAIRLASESLTLAVDVAASGENSLGELLAARGENEGAVDLAIETTRLDAVIRHRADGSSAIFGPGRAAFARHDGQLASLDVEGPLETALGAGPLTVSYQRLAPRRFALRIQAPSLELAQFAPLTSSLAGATLAGRGTIALDLAADLEAGRVALVTDTVLDGFQASLPALLPATVTDTRLSVRGSLDIDASARRVEAAAFVLRSQALHVDADGTSALRDGGLEGQLTLSFGVNFDRAALRYPGLWTRLLPIVDAAGAFAVDVVPQASTGEAAGWRSMVRLTTDALIARLAGGEVLALGEGLAEAEVVAADSGLAVPRLGFAFDWLQGVGHGQLRTAKAAEASPRLTGDLEIAGGIHLTKLSPIIGGFFAALPLQLNGEGEYRIALERGAEDTHLLATMEGADLALRHDDVRDGHSDTYMLHGLPLRLDLDATLRAAAGTSWRDAEAALTLTAGRLRFVRDELENVTLRATVAGSRLELEPFQADYQGGRAAGRGSLAWDADVPILEAELSASQVELRGFPALLSAVTTGVLVGRGAPYTWRADNRVDGRLAFRSRGDSLTAMMRAAEGDLLLEIGRGSIRGAPVLDLWRAAGADGGVTITSLSSAVRIVEGRLLAERVVLVADGATLALDGEADARGEVRFVVDPEGWFSKQRYARLDDLLPPDALKIGGAYDDPRLALAPSTAFDAIPDGPALEAAVRDFVADPAAFALRAAR
jgi:hypothetical protein